MKKKPFVLLFILLIFMLSACTTTSDLKEPQTVKVSTTPEYDEWAKAAVQRIMTKGVLPEGFDNFTIDYDSAKALTTKTPEEIKEAIHTIGDVAVYFYVSGISENGFHTKPAIHDGRKMLLSNICWDCGASTALCCYLLEGDYEALGLTRIHSSEIDESFPERPTAQHSFPWVYDGKNYCFYDFYSERQQVEPWKKCRVVEKPEDLLTQFPYWYHNNISLVAMCASTSQTFPRTTDRERKLEVFPIEAKDSVRALYINPKDPWNLGFKDFEGENYSEWKDVATNKPKLPCEPVVQHEIIFKNNTYFDESIFNGAGFNDFNDAGKTDLRIKDSVKKPALFMSYSNAMSYYSTLVNNTGNFEKQCPDCSETHFVYNDGSYECTSCHRRINNEELQPMLEGVWFAEIGKTKYILFITDYSDQHNYIYYNYKVKESDYSGHSYDAMRQNLESIQFDNLYFFFDVISNNEMNATVKNGVNSFDGISLKRMIL